MLAPGLGSAILGAGVLDGAILRWRRGRWEFPDGAILSAMLVAMVLSAHASTMSFDASTPSSIIIRLRNWASRFCSMTKT